MSQFTCEICGDGFEQKSRFERHMDTSHPKRAPSAADLEKVLAGIRYPKTREEVVDHASQNVSDKDLMSLVKSLPSRTYRDSAEVAIALGEVKSGQRVRSAEETAKTEAPSTKGGRVAATEAFSAVSLAKVLSGIDFPKRKEGLKDYAQRHAPDAGIKDTESVLNVIDRLPDREYTNMADIEKSLGQVL
jgi:Protein of unknown function (DUF2795)